MKELLQKIELFTTRRSIRQFTKQAIPQEVLAAVVTAGLAAPSAYDRRPVHFITVTDPQTIKLLAKDTHNEQWLSTAAAAIVVCGDGMMEADHDLLAIAAAIAGENVLLACHALGLGATWCGVGFDSSWETAIQTLLRIPAEVRPVALIGAGYPAETPADKGPFDADRVHSETY